MARSRSFLFDSGVLYVNVDVVANANAITTVAGGVANKKIRTAEIKPYGSIVQLVTGTNDWYVNKDIIITNILATVRGQTNYVPKGQDLITVLKKNNASNSVTTTLSTITIPANLVSNSVNTTLSVLAGDKIFFDVTQVGTNQIGQGLKLDITYY